MGLADAHRLTCSPPLALGLHARTHARTHALRLDCYPRAFHGIVW
jgi:hypothetical protein